MVVTEKCDVYSFGVLTLEVVMGKHPGEFIFSLNSNSVRSINYEELLDPRLSPPTCQDVADKLAAAMGLANSCLAVNPEYRPTMRSVAGLFEMRTCSMT